MNMISRIFPSLLCPHCCYFHKQEFLPTLDPTTSSPTLLMIQTTMPTLSPSQSSKPPTNIPTGQPFIPTLRPSLRPSLVPTRKATNNLTKANIPTVTAPSDSDVISNYYCAKMSYTESWNIVLDFNCELPCPSGALDCPDGHQCQTSDYCSSIQG